VQRKWDIADSNLHARIAVQPSARLL